MARPRTCDHCGLDIPQDVQIYDNSSGRELAFCCHGCLGAWRIITGAGLEAFYERRDWPRAGVSEGAFDAAFDDTALAGYVLPEENGLASISFLVDGIRCATCIWLLERMLSTEKGILEVRVNYGTHRARVLFDPQDITPASIFSRISSLGYMPRPWSQDAAQQASRHEQRSLLIRFGTACFLSMQLMGYSLALYAGYFHGIEPGIRQLIQYFAAAVTTPVVFYSGWPFLAGAWRSLRNRTANMDLLIALGVLSAFGYSLYAMMTGGEVYFDSAAMIVTLILLGRLLENVARNRSMSSIDKLLQLAPDQATRIDGDTLSVVASSSLAGGDTILVKPGDRVPVDGTILDGSSEFDESAVTGESMPVLREPGAALLSGVLNMSASVTLAVDRPAAASFIARVARLIEEAQARRAPVQAQADRIAAWFVPVVIALSFACGGWWLLHGELFHQALLHAVAVLVVACPCALGLATPTAVLVATGHAAEKGILFRGGDVVESLARITRAGFDKTGTLTLGRPQVTRLCPAEGVAESDLVRLADRAEAGSAHPLARGIRQLAERHAIPAQPSAGAITIPGRGVILESADGEILLGNRLLLAERNITLPDQPFPEQTEVHLAAGGTYKGTILFDDPLRSDAAETIAALGKRGISSTLLTGDRLPVAEQVGREIGFESILAELKPADKARWVTDMQDAGETVLMVGDGINDAPALSAAAVSCAMAGGTDIALEHSDVVLSRPELGRLLQAHAIARRTLSVIRQNLFWAFSYNLVAIPLAFSGKLAPVWAAAAMAASSVLVVTNSLRLGRN